MLSSSTECNGETTQTLSLHRTYCSSEINTVVEHIIYVSLGFFEYLILDTSRAHLEMKFKLFVKKSE